MADNIFPRHAPHPTAVVGWDGTNFRVYTVDAAGHLQIDVLTSGLPLGAATAANQVLILARLQLIDDLTHALDSVDTDELVVNVDESVLPPLAATTTNQATMLTRMPDVLFNYADPYRFRRIEPNAAAPTDDLLTPGSGAGQVLMVTTMYAFNNTTNITEITLGQRAGANVFQVHQGFPTAIGMAVFWRGLMPVQQGYEPWAYFAGNAAGDDLYFDVTGYLMALL